MHTLIIDNYDSFTYNLYQYIGELGGDPVVFRNNEISIGEIESGGYSRLVISPGPGDPTDPSYFGICKQVILELGKRIPLLGVCLGHQGILDLFHVSGVAALDAAGFLHQAQVARVFDDALVRL